jgi:hypothetical protein
MALAKLLSHYYTSLVGVEGPKPLKAYDTILLAWAHWRIKMSLNTYLGCIIGGCQLESYEQTLAARCQRLMLVPLTPATF